jgi:hypothetical protein
MEAFASFLLDCLENNNKGGITGWPVNPHGILFLVYERLGIQRPQPIPDYGIAAEMMDYIWLRHDNETTDDMPDEDWNAIMKRIWRMAKRIYNPIQCA